MGGGITGGPRRTETTLYTTGPRDFVSSTYILAFSFVFAFFFHPCFSLFIFLPFFVLSFFFCLSLISLSLPPFILIPRAKELDAIEKVLSAVPSENFSGSRIFIRKRIGSLTLGVNNLFLYFPLFFFSRYLVHPDS